MAITEFGKAVRKARIDAGVTLVGMADELGTTTSFLSAMEMGRKKIPASWVEKMMPLPSGVQFWTWSPTLSGMPG